MASPRAIPRLTTAVALALLTGAAVWTIARAPGDERGPVIALAIAGLACAVTAIVAGSVRLLVVAAGALAGGFLLGQVDRGTAVVPAAVFGVLLFVAVEIGSDACLAEGATARDAGAEQRRALEVAVAALAGTAASALVASAPGTFGGGGAVRFVGAAVAAAVFVLLIGATSRPRTSPRRRNRSSAAESPSLERRSAPTTSGDM